VRSTSWARAARRELLLALLQGPARLVELPLAALLLAAARAQVLLGLVALGEQLFARGEQRGALELLPFAPRRAQRLVGALARGLQAVATEPVVQHPAGHQAEDEARRRQGREDQSHARQPITAEEPSAASAGRACAAARRAV
jgi:hypothetical protein